MYKWGNKIGFYCCDGSEERSARFCKSSSQYFLMPKASRILPYVNIPYPERKKPPKTKQVLKPFQDRRKIQYLYSSVVYVQLAL